MNLTKDEVDELQNALLPFAMMGSECEDGRTTFRINFGQGTECITSVTERDFVRAYQMFVKLGANNMPDFIRPEGKSEADWPLRGADGKPFWERKEGQPKASPPGMKKAIPEQKPVIFPWIVLGVIFIVVVAMAAIGMT